MNKNGCWNRKTLREMEWVQSGWHQIYGEFGSITRHPVMIEIPDPMTKTCQYQILKKDDEKCQGCKELEL